MADECLDPHLLQALEAPPLLGLGFSDLSGLDEYEKKFLLLLQAANPRDFTQLLQFVNETVANYGVSLRETTNARPKRNRTSQAKPQPKYTELPRKTHTPKPVKTEKETKPPVSPPPITENPQNQEKPKETQEAIPDYIPLSLRKAIDPGPTIPPEMTDPVCLLTRSDSPLAQIDLKDVLNSRTFALLASSEKNALLELLVPYDRASLYYLNATLRTPQLVRDMRLYQSLLAQGYFEADGKKIYDNQIPIHTLFRCADNALDSIVPVKSEFPENNAKTNQYKPFQFLDDESDDGVEVKVKVQKNG